MWDQNDQSATYDDVMTQLRARTPETDGRWTASQAASIYGQLEHSDEYEQFDAETGLAEARERMQDPDGGPSQVQGAHDYAAGLAIADSTRNRYQQTTGFDHSAEAAEQLASIDAGYAEAATQFESGRDYWGQAQQAAEVMDYGRLTGNEAMMDPSYQSAGLSPDQQEQLRAMRATEIGQLQAQADVMDYGRLTGNDAMMDWNYQSAGLSPEQQTQLQGLRESEAQGHAQAALDAQVAQEQRLQESSARAEARMAVPLEERESAGGAFGAPTYADRAAQWVEQGDVHEFGRIAGDAAMASPDYQSAGLSPEQQEQLDAVHASDRAFANADRNVRSHASKTMFYGTEERAAARPERERLEEEFSQARTDYWEQREEVRRNYAQGSGAEPAVADDAAADAPTDAGASPQAAVQTEADPRVDAGDTGGDGTDWQQATTPGRDRTSGVTLGAQRGRGAPAQTGSTWQDVQPQDGTTSGIQIGARRGPRRGQ